MCGASIVVEQKLPESYFTESTEIIPPKRKDWAVPQGWPRKHKPIHEELVVNWEEYLKLLSQFMDVAPIANELVWSLLEPEPIEITLDTIVR